MVMSNGSGIVHRAHDDRFACLDTQARNDACHRCVDGHLAQDMLSASQIGRLLREALFLSARLRFPRVQLARAHPHLAFRGGRAPLRTTSESFRSSRVRAAFCSASSRFARAVSTAARAVLSDSLAARSPAAPIFHGTLGRFGIDQHQELSQRHLLTFFDSELGDPTHRVGADIHQPLRLDLSGCRDGRHQVPPLDPFDLHFGAERPPVIAVRDISGPGQYPESGDGRDHLFGSSCHCPGVESS